ncbi:MAG: hypothetical protein HZB76_04655, partial [Chlamydiae bacterium]|nr:hypothetical protein [Chlamydiota bacterium]
MRINFLTVFLIFMMGCSDYGSSKRERVEHEVTRKTVKEICQNKNLKFLGFGGGGPYDIRVLSLSFETCGKFNVEEARELLVYCVEQFLLNINSNEKIRPFLHNFPFTGKNIEIMLFFYNKDASKVNPPYISYAVAIDGVVRFYIKNSFDKFEKVSEETYEKALKKVKAK